MSSRCVLRGGCWRNTPIYLRSSNRINRINLTPDFQLRTIGFRLVREPKSHRMLRGGSWGSFPQHSLRAAFRVNCASSVQDENIGFRLVREQK